MMPEDCLILASNVVKEKPDWFKDGKDTTLDLEEHEVAVPGERMAYYKLGLPVLADRDVAPDGSRFVSGVAGDCKFVRRLLCLLLYVIL